MHKSITNSLIIKIKKNIIIALELNLYSYIESLKEQKMKYLKNISLFLLILGCKSIPNGNFNLHDTNHKLGKLKFQEDSIISRNYDNKISIVGVYNPLTEKENFKVNIFIKKKDYK